MVLIFLVTIQRAKTGLKLYENIRIWNLNHLEVIKINAPYKDNKSNFRVSDSFVYKNVLKRKIVRT